MPAVPLLPIAPEVIVVVMNDTKAVPSVDIVTEGFVPDTLATHHLNIILSFAENTYEFASL